MSLDFPVEWLPSQLVALVALGIGSAFLGADRHAPTSRALGTAFIAFMADPRHRAIWSAGGFDPPGG